MIFSRRALGAVAGDGAADVGGERDGGGAAIRGDEPRVDRGPGP